MKVGDILYCKKSSCFVNKGEKYLIVRVYSINETIHVKCLSNNLHSDETHCFHIGEYNSLYYNFSDYFYTASEYRKLKLEKLNNI